MKSPLPTSLKLPIRELVEVMEGAKVRQIIAETHARRVTVDYFPPRAAQIFAREEDDGPIETYAPKPITLIFILEDAMFGGEVWTCVTCDGRVVIRPFPWSNYEDLGKMSLAISTSKA